MSTHMPGFLLFFKILHNFVLVKLAPSSIRVKYFGADLSLRTRHEWVEVESNLLTHSCSNKKNSLFILGETF